MCKMLKTGLLPYQKVCFDKLKNIRYNALFLDMGMGKTRTSLEFINYRKNKINYVLWFCPRATIKSIEIDIKKHSYFSCGDFLKYENNFISLVSLEGLSSSVKLFTKLSLLDRNNIFVIVDESELIKNRKTKRFARLINLFSNAKYRMLLSGLPNPEGLVDFYSQFYFLHKNILGYEDFRDFENNHLVYRKKDFRKVKPIAYFNSGWLNARISNYIFKANIDDYIKLSKEYKKVTFDLSGEQKEVYKKVKGEILMGKDIFDVSEGVIFKLFIRLQQISCGFYFNEEKKEFVDFKCNPRIKYLKELLLEMNGAVIIYCRFLKDVENIKNALKEDFSILKGGMGKVLFNKNLNDFLLNKKRFLICTLGTGSYGLNLINCNNVVYYNNSFKYSHREQSERRVYRFGQKKEVKYFDLISKSGIDLRLMDSLKNKKDLLQYFKKLKVCGKGFKIG